MKIFIAINLPKEIKYELYSIQGRLKNLGKVVWVPKKNFHLTLKFLGYIDKSKLALVKEKLAKLKFKKFKLTLNDIGFFPNASKPRVVWIGISPANKFIELQHNIDGELLSLFPEPEKFTSHITLGRIKILKNKELLKKLPMPQKLEFEVNSFGIMESKATKDSPEYIVLETYSIK